MNEIQQYVIIVPSMDDKQNLVFLKNFLGKENNVYVNRFLEPLTPKRAASRKRHSAKALNVQSIQF